MSSTHRKATQRVTIALLTSETPQSSQSHTSYTISTLYHAATPQEMATLHHQLGMTKSHHLQMIYSPSFKDMPFQQHLQ